MAQRIEHRTHDLKVVGSNIAAKTALCSFPQLRLSTQVISSGAA